ncbi:hypothetical protein [Paeniglutamicibacter terrestris]|uniref:Uncharacterized protein n=1 Tax=Paeniglutamicibacter terrestris TaxID=2723403 RepID=A0ABX1G7J8_9MICC|nr:hypothetical protein [Paeniglutamicibacter terrestris]NKG22243.1 hypothetical protein [Paeniglutamicibacter terrestris]
MRYFAIFLLLMNTSIAVWCLSVGSFGWVFSLVGIVIAIYMIFADIRHRATMEQIDADHKRRMAEINRRWS